MRPTADALISELSLASLTRYFSDGVSKRDLAKVDKVVSHIEAALENNDPHVVAIAALRFIHQMSCDSILAD
jgi:nucleoside-diphosphate-sugar epimerase